MENPLIKKLKIKPGQQLLIINAPEDYIEQLRPALPENIKISGAIKPNTDWAQLFVKNKMELDTLFPDVLKALKPDGILWICYPKGTSGIQTDLTRDKGWDDIMAYNLHWITLISVDDKWSGFALRNKIASAAKPKIKKEEETSEIKKYIDPDKKTVKVPPLLLKALDKNKKAKEYFNTLSYSNRKEYVIWILEAKQIETRDNRITAIIKKLAEGLKNPSDKAK